MLKWRNSSSGNNLLPKDLLNGLMKASDPIERVLMQEDRHRMDGGRPSFNGGGYGAFAPSRSGSVSGSVSPSAPEEAQM